MLNRKKCDMKNYKLGLGIIGEMFSNAVVKSVFKTKKGFRVKHVNWNNYTHGSGLDLRVFRQNKLFLGIEVKNWRYFDRPYGLEFAISEIIDRFKEFTGDFKILIISFKSLLTKKAILLLNNHHIHILEVGKLMNKNDFPRKGKTNTVYFSLTNKLLRLYQKLKHESREGFGVGCLDIDYNKQDTLIDDYLDTTKSTNHYNKNNNILTKQSTIKHDTNVNKTDSYALKLLKSVMKQAQNRKRSKLMGLNPV